MNRRHRRSPEYLDQTDQVWGFDRYPESQTFGTLVIPIINLWKRPGCDPEAENLSGALPHGFDVHVLKKVMYKREPWFEVRAEVFHDGQIYPQQGWCKAQLLRSLGEELSVFDTAHRVAVGA